MKSDDGSAGESCARNVEIGQLCASNSVIGMNSVSDSFSEKAVDKASTTIPNAPASDNGVVQSRSQCRRVPLAHNNSLSCGNEIGEHASTETNTDDATKKYIKRSIITGVSPEVLPDSLQIGFCSQNPSLVGIPSSENTEATNLLKIQNTISQASDEKIRSYDQNSIDVKDDELADAKDELLQTSTEHLVSLSHGGALSGDCGDLPAVPSSSDKNDDMELESNPIDETDDSDMEEHDVKVCDICGESGREDLLAICCRCSDGAEHTYCMREMLAEVPEDWLCEECKNMDQVGNRCQEKDERMDENDKNNSSGQASSEHVNSSDVEGRRTKSYLKVPCKRHRDDADAEVSSIAKKPAFESMLGPVKIPSSSKTAVLSRESSLKNLDKGKVYHHSSSVASLVNNTTESATAASDPRVHNSRGTFSKSNSFNYLNSKPKVKLVDQVVIQRQKSAKEYGSFRLKDGAFRSIGKSMSFKSTNSSLSESKMKMISPRFSHIQDTKNTKHRSPFERQHSFRAEHSSVNSMKGPPVSSTSKLDKRPVSRGDSSLTITANHQEMKPLQADSKLAAFSRSSSLASRRTSDLSNSSGEFKRLPVSGNNTRGFSSANGVNSVEQKSNLSCLKEESLGSVTAEESPVIANESPPDALPQSRNSTNAGERMREYSGSRLGLPSAKSSRVESDNLKAAIEAAILKKPGGYRKNKGYVQSDDSSFSRHLPTSAGNKKLASDAELPDRATASQNLIADSLNHGVLDNVNLKQSSLAPLEGGFPSGGRDGACIGPYSRDIFSSAMAPFLKSLAIPEHECIWQGSFEIHRNGKSFDLWSGIQAHISTCASSKVSEAADKFKSRVVLYEVPRSITWPTQFHEDGVSDDNIALFFFAKDLESYVKIYKVLLDNMMKNDLALKGNVDGVEILIFPSNQLPDNFQRWNMLFFLWGVFRAKKESCQHHVPESSKQFATPPDIPTPIMTVPDNIFSQKPIADDLHATENAARLLETSASEKLLTLLTSASVNQGLCSRASFLDQLGHRLNSSSSTAVPSSGEKNSQEMKDPCVKGHINSCSSPSPVTKNSSCSEREQIQSSHLSSKSVAGETKNSASEGTITDKTCTQNQGKLRKDSGDPPMDGDSHVKNVWFPRDLNMEPDRNDDECAFTGSCNAPQPLDATYSQVSVSNDGPHDEPYGALKKVNHLPSEQHHGALDVETLILEGDENTERHFFPLQSSLPVKGVHFVDGSMPWKVQDAANNLVPNLDLALGAKERLLTLGIQPFLFVNRDEDHPKVNDEYSVKEAGRSKVEDDKTASLSLSLSSPFPDTEVGAKPAPKIDQRLSLSELERSMLLFGKLGKH